MRQIKTYFCTILLILCSLWLAAGQSGTGSLSMESQQELLNAHNFFRGIVDPPASNMERMEWNSELAGVAQSHSATCMLEFNVDRVSQQSTFATIGESFTAIGSSDLGNTNYTMVIEQTWQGQNTFYDYDSNTCSSGAACGQYTQLVWATSSALGCGASVCPMLPGFPVPNSIFLVCNYGPSGNIPIGERPYRTGTPCSECPAEVSGCIENLCSMDIIDPMTISTVTTATTLSPPSKKPLSPDGYCAAIKETQEEQTRLRRSIAS